MNGNINNHTYLQYYDMTCKTVSRGDHDYITKMIKVFGNFANITVIKARSQPLTLLFRSYGYNQLTFH